jgi:hypothetical protein
MSNTGNEIWSAATIIAVLSFLVSLGSLGVAWSSFSEARKVEERAAARSDLAEKTSQIRSTLHDFLMPLQRALLENRHLHGVLTEDHDLKRLEYAPDYVQSFFRNLPDDDLRKFRWQEIIGRMVQNNNIAIDLIRTESGFLDPGDINKALSDFVEHANQFNVLWAGVVNENSPSSPRGAGALLVPLFPPGLDDFLQSETQKKKDELKTLTANRNNILPHASRGAG